MIDFPSEFFLDEVKNGFYVSSEMKQVWATELIILDAIKTLCEKYHLRWYADYGTLLGAVRHGGFIPWDDDIDITMPRKDYMELIAHADELLEPYRIISIYSSDTFYQFHAIVKNTRADRLERDRKREEMFHGCPYIVDLDIFPLDNIPRDPEKAVKQKQLYNLGYHLVHTLVDIEEGRMSRKDSGFDVELEQYRKALRALYGERIEIRSDIPLRQALCISADSVASSCEDEDADEIDYFAHQAFLESPLLRKKEWYRSCVDMPFETTTIRCPAVYTAVLKKRFGENYMRPVREQAAHDYPFFKKQKEYFELEKMVRAGG